jgi:hypothetical protein
MDSQNGSHLMHQVDELLYLKGTAGIACSAHEISFDRYWEHEDAVRALSTKDINTLCIFRVMGELSMSSASTSATRMRLWIRSQNRSKMPQKLLDTV